MNPYSSIWSPLGSRLPGNAHGNSGRVSRTSCILIVYTRMSYMYLMVNPTISSNVVWRFL